MKWKRVSKIEETVFETAEVVTGSNHGRIEGRIEINRMLHSKEEINNLIAIVMNEYKFTETYTDDDESSSYLSYIYFK